MGLVLLIACVNVASLLLARSEEQGREVAIRAALGARPKRLVQQLLTESLLLSAFGGGLGLVLAYWVIRILIAAGPPEVAVFQGTGIDRSVVTFGFLVTVLTGILFGVALQTAVPHQPERSDKLGHHRFAPDGGGPDCSLPSRPQGDTSRPNAGPQARVSSFPIEEVIPCTV